jgi:hypothetical protein
MRKKGTGRSGRQDNELICDPLSPQKHRALQCLYFNPKQSISVDNKGETTLAVLRVKFSGRMVVGWPKSEDVADH